MHTESGYNPTQLHPVWCQGYITEQEYTHTHTRDLRVTPGHAPAVNVATSSADLGCSHHTFPRSASQTPHLDKKQHWQCGSTGGALLVATDQLWLPSDAI